MNRPVGNLVPGRRPPVRPDRAFFDRPALDVAPALLGLRLVRAAPEGRRSGIIVEAEAYVGPQDRASHSRAGVTPRTATMFGPPGHAYVYLVYGMHWCSNVVVEREGFGAAVLLRALLPEEGVDAQRESRGRPAERTPRLCAGPARLCQALGIDRGLDTADLVDGDELWLEWPETDAAWTDPRGEGLPAGIVRPSLDGPVPRSMIVSGPRVGCESADPPWDAAPYRFGIAGHPALSRPFRR